MGNGGIAPFVGAQDIGADLQREADLIQVVRDYYAQVYNAQNLGALPQFTTPGVKVHREGKISVGRPALLAQITETLGTHDNLQVLVQEIVATGNRVAYRINVEFDAPGGGGGRRRVRGIGLCRLTTNPTNPRIAESSVSYAPEEPV
jgi:hypothetical protein